MKVNYHDLFELNQSEGTMSPKRELRLGAAKLLPEHVLDLNEASLGAPLSTWIDRDFEIKIDKEFWTIIRIYPADTHS